MSARRPRAPRGPRAWLALRACCLAWLLAAAAGARADKLQAHSGGVQRAAAAPLMRAGLAALEAGDLAAAEQHLGAAYRRWAGPEILYHLGLIAEKKGQLLAAQDLLRRYQSDPASRPDATMNKEIQRVLSQSRPPAGKVLVLGDSAALVRVDDRLVGSLPLVQPLLVSPEPHQISVTFPDQVLTAQVDVPLGRLAELRVSGGSKAVLLTLLPAYIVIPDYQGLPADTEHQVDEAIEHAFQAEKKSVLRRDIALRKAPELRACLNTVSCQDQLAAKNEADGLLAVQVGHSNGGHRVALRLLDSATGDIAGRVERDVLSDRLIAQLQKDVTQLLVDSAARTRGILTVRTEPAGAEIVMGDRVLGQTPYLRPSFTGQYELVLNKPGFDTVRQHIEVAEGRTTEVIVGMARDLPEPRPAPLLPRVTVSTDRVRRPRPTWRLVLGGASMSAGALVLGIGINALQLGDTCLDRGFTGAPGALCGSRLMPAAFSTGTMASGLLLIAGGISLVAMPGRTEETDRYTHSPVEPLDAH